MKYVYERLAELTRIGRKRKLTEAEQLEQSFCLDVNEGYAFKISSLENYSLMASLTNDTEWQHDICADLEKLHDGLEEMSNQNNWRQP